MYQTRRAQIADIAAIVQIHSASFAASFLTQLGARLHGVFTQRGSGERVIFINADDEVPYGTIVQAMDICRGAGAEDVGIVTEAIEVSK